MNDGALNIVLGLVSSLISAAGGWLFRTYLWRRQLRRKQKFFGLSNGSECLLVVNQDPSAPGRSVQRYDAFALLELSALIKECGARAEIVVHDIARLGFGTRTEFCVGGPGSNRRTEAHLRSLLPGVEVNTDHENIPDGLAFTIGGQAYRISKGIAEYALLARLTAPESDRPVFLAAGQRGINNQAAIRYLARHHVQLARQYGADGVFCLLLKALNSDQYGPDMVEVVADVTVEATAPR